MTDLQSPDEMRKRHIKCGGGPVVEERDDKGKVRVTCKNCRETTLWFKNGWAWLAWELNHARGVV